MSPLLLQGVRTFLPDLEKGWQYSGDVPFGGVLAHIWRQQFRDGEQVQSTSYCWDSGELWRCRGD